MTKDQLSLLKAKLQEDYVPYLPELIPNSNKPEDNEKKNISRALSAFVLQHLCHCDAQHAAESVVDDYQDHGIDAIYYSTLQRQLYLVQAKFTLGAEFQVAEANTFTEGVRDLLDERYDRFNSHVTSRKLEIERALEQAEEIILVIAHVGKVSHHAGSKMTQSIADLEDRVRSPWIDYDSDKLLKALLSPHEVPPIDKLIVLENARKGAGDKNVYYGQIPLQVLVDLHQEHQDSLFHKNIRTFLGSNSKVNQSIQSTLQHTPELFFYYNNGVTMVAQKVTPRGEPQSKIKLELSHLSVINGAQTIASATESLSQSTVPDLSQAMVMLTIIESDGEFDFTNHITKKRNHQNTVHSKAFSALDPLQERLRKEVLAYGIEYQYRMENVYASSRGERCMDINEAVFVLACRMTDPNTGHNLKKSFSDYLKLDSERYTSIFNDQTSGLKLINAIRFYRAADRLLHNQAEGDSQSNAIKRHGHFVIIWAFFQRHKDLFERSDLVSEPESLQIVSPLIDPIRQQVIDYALQRLAINGRGPLFFFNSREESRNCSLHLKKNT